MQRLTSLDAFRGATIASMILVNNPGSWSHVYPPLLHAKWHGWTFTDLVFPFFLWIVGVAMTLSFARRVERGEDRARLFRHVLLRSAILFLLGLALNFASGSLATLRIPGVLQRIAVCYLIASAIYLWLGVRGCALATVGLLAAYWALMMLVPVPGHGAGVLTKEGNLAHYVDSVVLKGHMWSESKTWDPEGVLSTLPAIATTLFGVLAGAMLRAGRSSLQMLAAGILLIGAGQWMDRWLPINKNLWTSSYSVFMAGMALALFALFHWVLDVRGWQRGARPFVIYGMNAITVFVLSGVVARSLMWTGLRESFYAQLAAVFSPKNASLAFALAHVLALYLAAWFMYRRKWIVRL